MRDRLPFDCKPFHTMHFSTSICSHTGGRTKNQDTADHFSDDELEGWVLADGLGGYRGGGLAASLATTAMLETCQEEREVSPLTIRTASEVAQDTLRERQQKHFEYCQMKTTFVLLLASTTEERALWGHVGDSRLYHFREGAVVAQTTDHSAAQAMVEAGDLEPGAIRNHQDRHSLTRALGDVSHSEPDIEQTPVMLAPGDAFLLCSDGFWEAVTEEEMIALLGEAETPEDWLDEMTAYVEERATPHQDNYTAVGVFVHEGTS